MGRLKRILRHPAAAVVLLAMLGVSVWSLPKGWYGGSAIGKWIGEWYLARPTGPYRPALEVYLIREGDRFVVHDPNAESFDVISRAINDSSTEILMAIAGWRSYQSGFYDLTAVHKVEYAQVVSLRNPTTLESAHIELARSVFIGWIASTEGGAWKWLADRVRHGDRHAVKVRWPGVLHNTAALTVLIALLYSLRWNLSPSIWRARQREKRLSRGECPRCRYSIQGLAENKCPECGEEWGTAEEQAARA